MPTDIDAETRAAGGPIEDPDHDDFGRVNYAQRIAETLIKRRSNKSIVVGLYGKWGEGKSSVLHFIKRSLAEVPDQVVVLNFNPWRFSDETQLLLNFFGELAKVIGQNLLTRKQRAVKGLSTYVAPLVPSISLGPVSADVGKSLEGLLKMAQPEIDDQRARIERLIVESGRRVVVIIDDIDRLEKSQIQAVFRLVKLTADFEQTSYLLSFDDEMVARAIGEAFSPSSDDTTGSRTLLAGQNFLEKIVQVPLRLPVARPDDLLQFCWNRLQEAFSETDTTLDADEQDSLISALRSAILPRLATPRLAVRFANAVQFGLPLLRGEVNTVDQILVEAMQVFFSQLHQFVATHESDFVGGFQSNVIGGNEEDHKRRVEQVLSSYKGDDYQAALSLLCALFPAITRLFHGRMPWMNSPTVTEEALTMRKAVASPSHFPRYFAYSVLRGDVSDAEFDEFLNGAPEGQLTTARDLIERLGASLFLQKIEYRVQSLTPAQSLGLGDVLMGVSDKFNGVAHGASFDLHISQERHASKLLIALLFRLSSPGERFQLIENSVATGGTFYMAKELQRALRGRRHRETGPESYIETEEGTVPNPVRLFDEENWRRLMEEVLPNLFLDRALDEAGTTPLYKSHPFYAFDLLFSSWPESGRQPDVVTYIRNFLGQEPEDIHDLMAICSDTITMGGRRFQANVTSSRVAIVAPLFGSFLLDEAKRALGDEQVSEYPGDERDYEQPTRENRLRQFIYLSEHPA